MREIKTTDCLLGRNLTKYFSNKNRRVTACDDVSIAITREKTVGLVGESGCGKTTVGRLLLRLIHADAGEVWYNTVNLTKMPEKEIRPLRKNFQMIFQDSKSAFNPRMRVYEALRESIRLYEDIKSREIRDRVMEIVLRVNLSRGILPNFIGNLSGGELKRLDIARALTIHPEYLIADEPLTLLDISIQGQIAQLLMDIQDSERIGILFISHDLRMVEMLSDIVVVMYRGKIIEQASRKDITSKPLHPYTGHLWNPRSSFFFIGFREGGCLYKNRCFIFQKREFPAICSEQHPELLEYGKGHYAACHFAGQLD
jgi:ABC-type oligopeptide transport system ATPase subunit